MDMTQPDADLKQKPGFKDTVGMILIPHGVVRNWSRIDKSSVAELAVSADLAKIEQLREEYLGKEGIFDIIIEARSGKFAPGDDLLFIIVAGDLRENIKPVLSDLLDRVKAEAISKKEITAAC